MSETAFDIRQVKNWFGPIDLEPDPNLPSPWNRLSEILYAFKQGNYSARDELGNICCAHRDEPIIQFGLSLYFLVARVEDLNLIPKFLDNADANQAAIIFHRARGSLIGLPLAIHAVSDFDPFVIREERVTALKTLMPSEHFSEVENLSSLADVLAVLQKRLPDVDYVFKGKPAFLGDIAISMQLWMQRAMDPDDTKMLGDSMGPRWLAAFSGLECPVSYTTIMTRDKVKAVLDYVKTVSAMGKAMGGWKRGSKYFYGHEIL
jgi:hypothetical protein